MANSNWNKNKEPTDALETQAGVGRDAVLFVLAVVLLQTRMSNYRLVRGSQGRSKFMRRGLLIEEPVGGWKRLVRSMGSRSLYETSSEQYFTKVSKKQCKRDKFNTYLPLLMTMTMKMVMAMVMLRWKTEY